MTFNGGFVGKRVTGVQRYAYEILRRFDAGLDDHLVGRSALSCDILTRENAEPHIELRNIKVRTTFYVPSPFWLQAIVPFFAKGLLVSFENIGCVLHGRRQVVCVHDLNTILAPESYGFFFRLYYKIFMPLGVRRSVAVTTVSDFSARMMVEHGLCAREKITVIPNGHEHVIRWDASRSRFSAAAAFERPFIFVLGSQARHKNVAILKPIAKALDDLGFDMVVAGPKDGPFSAVDTGAASNIRSLGFVSDDDLAALYRRAFCFVFPSYTEGFGLPALEALALGCPVIASDVASLPEVCGSAALYADPHRSEDWLEQITRLKADPALRQAMIEAGHARAKLFSWESSAAAYENLINVHRSLSPS